MKKKHLSRLVTERILLMTLGLFTALIVITVIFIYNFGRSRTDSLLRFSLEDEKRLALNRMRANWEINVPGLAMQVDDTIREHGIESEELEHLLKEFHEEAWSAEVSVIDKTGVVVASSDKGNVGYDMHSDPRSAQFLCLLDGEDIYFQDTGLSPLSGKIMCYSGAPLYEYGGFYLEGVPEDQLLLEEEGYYAGQVRFDGIGKKGYFLLTDKDDKIIGSPSDAHIGELLVLPEDIKKLSESGKIIKADMFGVRSYVGVIAANDDHIIAVYSLEEAWETWNAAMLVLFFIYILVFVLLLVLLKRMIAKLVVKGVYSLDASLGRITEGDLNERADFRESIEFDELSNGINYTVDRLKELIREAEERIDAELALAARIQISFIPHKFPAFPDRNEFDLFAAMIPAKDVGGDFYDYFLIDDDHLALVMADVSGKGIPAAMFMVMAKDKIQHFAMKYCTDVSQAVTEVNLELIKENDAGLFVTVWLGVITLSTGHVDYVDAGHNYPVICRAGRRFAIIEDEHSGPVAAFEEMPFDAGSFDLHPGDILYLYTDGITEANDPCGEMFRPDRMIEALNSDTEAPVEEIDSNVRKAIDDFSKDAPQFDDMTSLVFRYNGT